MSIVNKIGKNVDDETLMIFLIELYLMIKEKMASET